MHGGLGWKDEDCTDERLVPGTVWCVECQKRGRYVVVPSDDPNGLCVECNKRRLRAARTSFWDKYK